MQSEAENVARISVLMPTYNGIRHIREAVESVRVQTLQHWELLISDDGSNDGTIEYLKTLADERIKLFVQPKNLGIFGNLNFLLERAGCEVAKIFCQDDALLPNALESCLAFMQRRPECAVARCWDVGDATLSRRRGTRFLERELPIDLHPRAAILAFATFGNLPGNLSTTICRPAKVLEVGGFNQAFPYAGDYEGWIRVARRYGLSLLREELVRVRVHVLQNSVLLNLSNELPQQIDTILDKMASMVPPQLLPLLKRHWTIHFLAPRLSKTVRLLLKRAPAKAWKSYRTLPQGISFWACIGAYPLWRLGANGTTRRLLPQILQLNDSEAPQRL
jgi:hypothetical protein